MAAVSMRDMLEAGVHFGHQTRFWNPKMRPYIFGERNKIHIIDLEKSLPLYNEALNFLGRAWRLAVEPSCSSAPNGRLRIASQRKRNGATCPTSTGAGLAAC